MAGQDDQFKPISLFYSYSHKDEDLRLKLETHLSTLRRGGLIAEWHDRKLEPGDAWKDEIDRHLTSADIVLLLVSSDFFASDYCWGEEMAKALERHGRGQARVIPVILRHCRWMSTPLAALQAVPRGAKPIKSWPDEDEAFDDVVAAIERCVVTVRRRTAPASEKRAFKSVVCQEAKAPVESAPTSSNDGPTVLQNQDTMAGYVDDQMKSYITWDALLAKCKPEAELRGVSCLNTIPKLRAHAKYRRDHDGWDVEMDDKRVRITRRR
jgi:hypothetical protein